jgi:hypothetical protein
VYTRARPPLESFSFFLLAVVRKNEASFSARSRGARSIGPVVLIVLRIVRESDVLKRFGQLENIEDIRKRYSIDRRLWVRWSRTAGPSLMQLSV